MSDIVLHNNAPLAPANAVKLATDVAGLCKEIVSATAQSIQGRKYVRVEGWQAIATAHGCVASARDVENIEGGLRCVGEVRRMDTGAVICTAEGFVGEDEKMWAGRPAYARRAMCQTRAISRACRSAFAHVVVMMNAGLETTPAEEVPAEGFEHAKPVNGGSAANTTPPARTAPTSTPRPAAPAPAPAQTDAAPTGFREFWNESEWTEKTLISIAKIVAVNEPRVGRSGKPGPYKIDCDAEGTIFVVDTFDKNLADICNASGDALREVAYDEVVNGQYTNRKLVGIR